MMAAAVDTLYKNIRTKALVVAKPKADFELQEVVYDEVRDDEYLIEMKYTGICHTVSAPINQSNKYNRQLIGPFWCDRTLYCNRVSCKAYASTLQSLATKALALCEQSGQTCATSPSRLATLSAYHLLHVGIVNSVVQVILRTVGILQSVTIPQDDILTRSLRRSSQMEHPLGSCTLGILASVS